MKEQILGFNVCTCNQEELLNNIMEDYKKDEQLFIVNINPEIIVTNYKNETIKKEFNNQKYQIPDGQGVVWASKKKKGNIKERITGIDLMQKICEKLQETPAKICLYGAKYDIIVKAKEELEKQYPKINIVQVCDGYCDEEIAIEKIQSSHADILFVGLGSPKQEEFILKNRNKLNEVKIFMPVGGSFDVISKLKKRAPQWMIKCHLEWLYRGIQEPKRFFRYYRLVKFICLIKGDKNGKN